MDSKQRKNVFESQDGTRPDLSESESFKVGDRIRIAADYLHRNYDLGDTVVGGRVAHINDYGQVTRLQLDEPPGASAFLKGALKSMSDQVPDKYLIKESKITEKMDKVVNFAGYTIRNDLGGTVQRQYVDFNKPGDHGADPLPDGKFKMVPSGDVVDKAERDSRLASYKSKRESVTEGVPEDHQTKIAIQTLKMNDVFARIMGGMDKDAARKHLKVRGWSDARIAKLEGEKMETITFIPKSGSVTEASTGKFKIYINGRYRYFDSLDAAKKVAKEIFDKTGDIVGIEAAPGGKVTEAAPYECPKCGMVRSAGSPPNSLCSTCAKKAYKKESKEYPVAGEDVRDDYYEWPHVGWWKSKESIAKNMTVSQLHYARLDCDKAARANPNTEGKYRDEGSIYAMEMRRRGQQKECSIQDTTARLLLKENRVRLGEEDPKLAGEIRCKKCGALKQKTPAGKLSCPVCRKPGQDSFIKGVPLLNKTEAKVQESEELVVQQLRRFANMDSMDAVHDYYHGIGGYQLSQKDAAAILGFYDKLDAARRTNYQWHDIPTVLKLARTGKVEGCDKMPWQRAKTIATKAKADDPDALAAHIQQKAKIGESLPDHEMVLYGVKKGDEDWQEVILSTKPETFDKVKVTAAKDGFHKFRVAKVDLRTPPDFTKTVKKEAKGESKVTEADMSVANTIRSQIPAGVLMNLGARDYLGDKDRLIFRVGGGGRKKMVIILDSSDTYTVQGWKWRWKDDLKDFYMVKEYKDVYAEDLPELLIKLNSILHGFDKADESKVTEAVEEDNKPYERKGGDIYRGQWSVEAKKLKNGDWMVTEYSAMAMGMAEPMGRFKTRAEAVAMVDRIANRKEGKK